MAEVNLEKVLSRVEDLPTLPRTMLKIMELVNDPTASAKDLAGVVRDDQVLTARLLRLVNSSFYGFPQRISTVTGAIVLLGFDAIRSLLLTTSVVEIFSSGSKANRLRAERLWDHSLGCAVGAKTIGKEIGYDKVEELFVAGLLHDIGKIVEMTYLEPKYIEICSVVEKEDVLIQAAEQMILGFTHAEVGKLLAEKWNLPAKFISVIACHHAPSMAGRFAREAAVVHVADIFSRAIDIGSGGDSKVPMLDREAWVIAGLGIDRVGVVLREMDAEYEDVKFFLDEPSGKK
jgi:putative nucleotidyltransferase with HDIG domain